MMKAASFSVALFAALPAYADVTLSATEIEALLSGNTINGTWSGSEYTQYFDPNGMTVYIPKGRQPDVGKWRVNTETDQYESWWEQTNWTGYTVLKTETGYGWKRSDGHEPFTVEAGKQITW